MTLTLERLQRLKRQAGGATSAPLVQAASPTILPVGLAHLKNLLRVRSKPSVVASSDRCLPGTEIAPGLYYTEERLPQPDLPDVLDGAFDRGLPVLAKDLMFFDTETTGLAGGTGTRAFMIGVADWSQGELRVRQLTIANMAAETRMLDTFARWLQSTTVLCSYNGKCYDAPLLSTRFRLARRPQPLSNLRHIDLLFPTRRRYRGVFENCRLATIERQVLQVVREDDLPGSEAPAAWLTYLRGGSASLLRRVVAHNRQDVISLARLFRHLADLGPTTTLTRRLRSDQGGGSTATDVESNRGQSDEDVEPDVEDPSLPGSRSSRQSMNARRAGSR